MEPVIRHFILTNSYPGLLSWAEVNSAQAISFIIQEAPGADAELLRGEGIYQIMHNAHAQTVDHAYFRLLVVASIDTKAKK